jgi:enediyne biosynthesis protein E4
MAVGDFNNDGLMDIFVATWIDETHALFENRGGYNFDDVTTPAGLSAIGYEYCAWGTKFFDYDNDGLLDLWVTFGHTDPQVEKAHPGDPWAEPNYMLRNTLGNRFVDVSAAAGLRKLPSRSGRGTAFADIDNDGDTDVLIVNKNDAPTLLRNDGGNRNNWLTIRAEGVKSNRSGIGARIAVTAGGKRRIFDVRSSESYLSSNDLRVQIGMANLPQADTIEIRWPSGQVDRYQNVPVDKFYLAREGNWLKPDPQIAPRKN